MGRADQFGVGHDRPDVRVDRTHRNSERSRTSSATEALGAPVGSPTGYTVRSSRMTENTAPCGSAIPTTSQPISAEENATAPVRSGVPTSNQHGVHSG